MDIEKQKEQIKKYFETHRHAEIMKDMYGDSVERMKSFDVVFGRMLLPIK